MTERITLRVSLAREDEAWLRQRADELDLDVGQVLRMIVRQAKRGTLAEPAQARLPAPTIDHDAERRRAEIERRRAAEREAERRAYIEAKKADLLKQLAELTGADQPNAILDDLTYKPAPDTLRQAEDERFLDEFEIPPDPDGGVASDEIGSLLAQASAAMTSPAAAAPRRGPPGTLTEPVGVNAALRSGYAQGDARGNLVRQNFGHLGFSGGVRG